MTLAERKEEGPHCEHLTASAPTGLELSSGLKFDVHDCNLAEEARLGVWAWPAADTMSAAVLSSVMGAPTSLPLPSCYDLFLRLCCVAGPAFSAP